MKLIRLLILLTIYSTLLAACGQENRTAEPTAPPAAEEEDALSPAAPVEAPTVGADILPRVTITPSTEIEAVPGDEAYPAATELPALDDGGYPAPVENEPAPVNDPYPAPEGSVWIIFPVGVQCGSEEDSRYPDLTAAVAGLTAAGITVTNSEMTDLIVCAACGCPTSAHYRVEIDGAQLNIALALEWQLEPEE